jgi:hypothetical protein
MGHFVRFVLAVVAAVSFLVGCVSTLPRTVHTASSTSAPRSYQPIDYKKWASGMYPDEFFGKAVVVDGYFFRRIFQEEVPGIAL